MTSAASTARVTGTGRGRPSAHAPRPTRRRPPTTASAEAMATVRCTLRSPCASGCTCSHVRSHAGSANGSYPTRWIAPAAITSSHTLRDADGRAGSPRSIAGRRAPRRRSPAAPRRARRPGRRLGATTIRPTPGAAGRRWRSTARATHPRARPASATRPPSPRRRPANAATIAMAGSRRSTDANRSWARAPSTVVMTTAVATASAASAAMPASPPPVRPRYGLARHGRHCAHVRGRSVSVFPAFRHRASPLGGDHGLPYRPGRGPQ